MLTSLEAVCKTWSHTLKSSFSDHLIQYVHQFVTLKQSNRSCCERFKIHVKSAYQTLLSPHIHAVVENVHAKERCWVTAGCARYFAVQDSSSRCRDSVVCERLDSISWIRVKLSGSSRYVKFWTAAIVKGRKKKFVKFWFFHTDYDTIVCGFGNK